MHGDAKVTSDPTEAMIEIRAGDHAIYIDVPESGTVSVFKRGTVIRDKWVRKYSTDDDKA